ncbi:MAG: alpha/beta hydrolase [Paracoccaceae bacterium]|jgi:pimeloyl-ACP methyl ester carboxylesterase|nr:alpha/beta hydrolase [Paracoccaceae bacterium]
MIWFLVVLLILGAIAIWPFAREAMRQPMDDAARRDAPGDFVELSQGITHFRWIGPVRGPVAVCVHGLTTPSMVWDAVAKGLALMGFRVLVYDLYGRGYSDRAPGLQDQDFFIRQLEDLLASQGITEDVTLLGYSMGGAIVSAFAARHPERVLRVILLAPAGMGHDLGKLAKFTRDTPILGDWLMLLRYPGAHLKGTEAERVLPSEVEGIVDYQQAELSKRGFVPAVLSSLRGILPRPLEKEHRAISREGIPVLAIWGRDDAVIPIRAMGQLTQWNRVARHEVIEGAGHGLTYTHAAAVLRAIEAGIAAEVTGD